MDALTRLVIATLLWVLAGTVYAADADGPQVIHQDVPDMSVLVAGMDFSTVNSGVLTIFAGLVVVAVVIVGGELIISRINLKTAVTP